MIYSKHTKSFEGIEKLRGLSYKPRHDMDKLLEIKSKIEEIQYFNTIEPYEIMPYEPSWN